MRDSKLVPIDVANGDYCMMIAGTHKGKTGRIQDRNVSKSGYVTITVMQDDGTRFKTLAKNVTAIKA